MPKNLYFALTDNDIAFSNDIIKVHYFMTGTKIDLDDHDAIRRAASTMSAVVRELEHPSVEFLVKHGHIVPAIRLYRDLNDCMLTEAKAAVDKIVAELEKR